MTGGFLKALVLLWLLGGVSGCHSAATTVERYLAEGEFEQAVDHLEAALAAEPDNPHLHFLMGRAYGRLGAYESMAASFANCLALDRGYKRRIRSYRAQLFELQIRRGAEHLEAEPSRFALAVRSFTDATAIDPESAEGWRHLGAAHEGLDSPAAAVTAYEKALALDDADEVSLRNAAELQVATGQHDRAVDTYRLLIDAHPDEAATYSVLGDLYRKLERFEEAIETVPDGRALRPR